MTTIIVLTNETAVYEDFNDMGMFIGTRENFADCFFTNVNALEVMKFAHAQGYKAIYYDSCGFL